MLIKCLCNIIIFSMCLIFVVNPSWVTDVKGFISKFFKYVRQHPRVILTGFNRFFIVLSFCIFYQVGSSIFL